MKNGQLRLDSVSAYLDLEEMLNVLTAKVVRSGVERRELGSTCVPLFQAFELPLL